MLDRPVFTCAKNKFPSWDFNNFAVTVVMKREIHGSISVPSHLIAQAWVLATATTVFLSFPEICQLLLVGVSLPFLIALFRF